MPKLNNENENCIKIKNTKTHKTRGCFVRRPDKKTQKHIKHMDALSEEQIKTQKHIKHKQWSGISK